MDHVAQTFRKQSYQHLASAWCWCWKKQGSVKSKEKWNLTPLTQCWKGARSHPCILLHSYKCQININSKKRTNGCMSIQFRVRSKGKVLDAWLVSSKHCGAMILRETRDFTQMQLQYRCNQRILRETRHWKSWFHTAPHQVQSLQSIQDLVVRRIKNSSILTNLKLQRSGHCEASNIRKCQ